MLTTIGYIIGIALAVMFPRAVSGRDFIFFKELLTKGAIALTAWSTWKVGGWSEDTAIKFATGLIVLSFVRDALLRFRGIKRMAPQFGVICIISLVLWCSLMMTLNWLFSQLNMLQYSSYPEMIAAGCWTAFALSVFIIFVEGSTRLCVNKLFGVDEGYYDRMIDYYENPVEDYGYDDESYEDDYCEDEHVVVSQPNYRVVDAPCLPCRGINTRNAPLIPRR